MTCQRCGADYRNREHWTHYCNTCQIIVDQAAKIRELEKPIEPKYVSSNEPAGAWESAEVINLQCEAEELRADVERLTRERDEARTERNTEQEFRGKYKAERDQLREHLAEARKDSDLLNNFPGDVRAVLRETRSK